MDKCTVNETIKTRELKKEAFKLGANCMTKKHDSHYISILSGRKLDDDLNHVRQLLLNEIRLILNADSRNLTCLNIKIRLE
jgi:hypothetical protein